MFSVATVIRGFLDFWECTVQSKCFSFFKNKIIYVFIGFVAAWGLSLLSVNGLLTAVDSLVSKHRP